MGEMMGKLVLAVDQRVPIGKETPAQGLVFTCDAVKQVPFHFLEVLDDFFGNYEMCLAIGRRLETLKSAHLDRLLMPLCSADADILTAFGGISSLPIRFDGGDEGEGVVGEVVAEGSVVTEFHEETAKDVGADVVVSVGFYAPGIGILFGH